MYCSIEPSMQVWGEVFGFAQRFVAFEECSPVRPPRPSRASARGTPLLHTPPRRTHHTHPRGCACSIDASPSKPSQMHRKVFEDPRPLPGARLLPNTSSSSSTTTQAPAAVPPSPRRRPNRRSTTWIRCSRRSSSAPPRSKPCRRGQCQRQCCPLAVQQVWAPHHRPRRCRPRRK